ncbi:MAG: VCBS repeat-containing protein [Flavobacteriaceae bacterium]|nr:VCBS repeat-containing protein [Flavobacteriaceae bacterium]
MMLKSSFIYFLIALLLGLSGCKDKTEQTPQPQQSIQSKSTGFKNFKKVDPSLSKLDFNNKITHDVATKFNLFDYDYFYNGSGVGVEDLNNDGLKDVVFCGNQVPNKIFLNKGNLVFEDITEKANINQNKNWSSGITFADVNQDGWMDIYISQGGPHEKSKRKNLLFINQKDLTFTEEGAKYGLDDQGISTQTAFFDYDKDGDLDCIVMNENDYYGTDPSRFFSIFKDKNILKENSSHLYENRNGKFFDVTEKSGLLKATFGLGLCVSDINNDNWPDIYIANDYYVPDMMYINNQDGTFSDQIKTNTSQVEFYGMGLDIADLNNDNLQDIFVLDMAASDHVRSKTLMASMNVPGFNLLTNTLGLQYQYMYNAVQINMGNNKYHNVAQLTGMAKTDWSWAALIFDTDLDANEDVYVTNGYRRYALDNDSRTKIAKARQQYQGRVPLEIKSEIYNSLPSEKLPNILFKNNGNLQFEDVTALSELNEPSFSNGAAYSDLDNDGDLDIIVNNMDSEAFLFQNTAIENNVGNYLKVITNGRTSEDFAKVQISFDNLKKTKESNRVRGYLSAVDKTIHFGLGKANTIDTLKVFWPSGKYQELLNVKANATITLNENEAGLSRKLETESNAKLKPRDQILSFTHVENEFDDFQNEGLLPYKQSTLGPLISKGDVNGDGLQDIYIGGAKGQAGQLFIQSGSGFINLNNPVFTNDAAYEDMEALFIDIENDGDNDLYIVSGGSEFIERSQDLKDRLYINDGKGNFSKAKSSEIDAYTISGKTVAKFDYDRDGDFDIIVGNRIKPQHFPIHEPSIIYQNNNGVFSNVTGEIAPEFEDFGIVNKVVATDFNNDGWQDFIVVGEWTAIGIFINNQGVFENIAAQSDLDMEKGWWFNVTETDVNNDGFKDYLLGNVGKNIKFKVSASKPLRVYADDFDGNGTNDLVLSYKYNDVFVPARGRECSSQQMPFIAEKIPTFNEFANSSLQDIYGEGLNSAYTRDANQFQSLLLVNNGDGTFKKMKLPVMAQSMPILDAAPIDYNNDGFEDLVIVGNIYNTEVETPRLDNSFGLILVSNQKDGYSVVEPKASGFYLNGNAKSVETVNVDGKSYIVVAHNNGTTQVFENQP